MFVLGIGAVVWMKKRAIDRSHHRGEALAGSASQRMAVVAVEVGVQVLGLLLAIAGFAIALGAYMRDTP